MNQVKPFSYPVESSYQLYLHFCILYFTQLLVVATLTFPLLATRPSHRPLACGQNQGGPQDTPSCFAAPRAHGQSFLGAALSFSTVELFTFTMHRLSSGLHQLLIMGW